MGTRSWDHAANGHERGLLGEVAGVKDIVHCGPVLTIVQQLVMLGVLDGWTRRSVDRKGARTMEEE